MLGIVLLFAGTGTTEATKIATIWSAAPAGVYASGSTFKVASPVHSPSEFLGVSSDSKVRFDLLPDFVRVSRMKNSRKLWQRKCADAVLLRDKLYCLYKNDLVTYNIKGRVEMRKNLTRSAIEWTYLDPNLRYAAGFRKYPSKPDSWPLCLLDLRTLRVIQLPLTYDLGGLADISIVSSETLTVLIDSWRTYLLRDERLYSPAWLQRQIKEFEYYPLDVVTVEGRIYLMQGKIGTQLSQVVEADTGQVIAESSSGRDEFVKGTNDQVLFYGFDGKQVIVYSR